jgi:hypothetical protein
MQNSAHEDVVTKELARQYGADSVRGGSYVRLVLTDVEKADLLSDKQTDAEFNSVHNLCQECGKPGHFVKTCPVAIAKRYCYRCRRSGHYPKDCTFVINKK